MRYMYIILALCVFGYIYDKTDILKDLRQKVNERMQEAKPEADTVKHAGQFKSEFQECVRRKRDMARELAKIPPSTSRHRQYSMAKAKIEMLCDGIQSQCLREYNHTNCLTIIDSYKQEKKL